MKQVGGTCTVALSGEVDRAARDELRSLLTTELDRSGAVVVDLREVSFLDSSGLAAIAAAYAAAQAADRSFTLVRARGSVLRVLEITGLMPLLSGRSEAPPTAQRSA